MAQTYHPFLKTTEWNVAVYSFGGGGTISYNTSNFHTINGLEYVKIKSFTGWAENMFVREDTTLQKVFIIRDSSISTSEGLLYDFSLKLGGIYEPSNIFGNPHTYLLDQIDSLLTADGYRKQFHFKDINNGLTVDVIEGVGSIEEPFIVSNFGLDPVFQLVCNFEDKQNVYTAPGLICTTAIADTYTNDSNLVLYPNPVKDVLNFNTKEKLHSVEIFDLQGKQVRVFSNAQNNLNVKDLSPGMYWLRAHSVAKIFYGKFVKL